MKKRSECPISNALDIWGDKWSLLLIRDLVFHEQRTYGEFLKSPEKIATNILASRLELLEKYQIIEKTDYPDDNRKMLYRLTNKGIDLLPILAEIYLWSDTYLSIPDSMRKITEEIKKDKPGFLKKTRERLRKISHNNVKE